MTSKVKKVHIIVIALVAALITGLFFAIANFQRPAQVMATTRTIEVSQSSVNYQSVLDSFENSSIETVGAVTTFEGTKTLSWADFEGLDNVSESDVQENIGCEVKYNVSYDKDSNIVTLSATMNNGEELFVENIFGVAFFDEDGKLDAVMNLDGETVLLSEMQDLGMIQNCGWFSNLFRKVIKAVVAVAAVAVCVATAGMATGAVIAIGVAVSATESVASQLIETGRVDIAQVAIAGAIGAIPGGAGAKSVATNIAKSTGKNVALTGSQKVAQGIGYNSFDAFKRAQGSAGTNKAWHHIVEKNDKNIAKFGKQNIHNTGNLVKIPGGYKDSLHSKITGFYNAKNPAVTGSKDLIVRDWLATKDFDFQYEFGVKKLKEFADNMNIKIDLP